jgi:hypothetical protein
MLFFVVCVCCRVHFRGNHKGCKKPKCKPHKITSSEIYPNLVSKPTVEHYQYIVLPHRVVILPLILRLKCLEVKVSTAIIDLKKNCYRINALTSYIGISTNRLSSSGLKRHQETIPMLEPLLL